MKLNFKHLATTAGLAVVSPAMAGAYLLGEYNKQEQERAEQRQMKYQRELINESNIYNSPAEQMKRLQEAGLNPNLVYSGGNVTGNQSATGTAPTTKAQDGLSNYLAMANYGLDAEIKGLQAQEMDKNLSVLEEKNRIQLSQMATQDKTAKAVAEQEQLKSNILRHDWDIIKKSDSTTSKETGVWPRLDRLFRGFDSNFQKSGDYLLNRYGK